MKTNNNSNKVNWMVLTNENHISKTKTTPAPHFNKLTTFNPDKYLDSHPKSLPAPKANINIRSLKK